MRGGTTQLGTAGWRLRVSFAAVGIAAILAPRPAGWIGEHVHKEDGAVFLSDAVTFGPSLWSTYSGYVHLIPRLLAWPAAELGPTAYPVAVAVLAGAFRVLLAVVVFPVFRERCGPRWGALAASMLVLVPAGMQEVLGNLTNLRWFCDATALLIAFRVTKSRKGAVAVGGLGAACMLTDPLTLGLVPLLAWRLFTNSGPVRIVQGLMLAGGATHVLLLEPGDRPAEWGAFIAHPWELLRQVLVRGPVEGQWGETGAEVIIRSLGATTAAVVALGVLVVLMAPGTSRRFGLLLAGWGLALVTATLLFADLDAISLDEWWGVGQASRYAVAPSIFIAQGLVLAAARARGPWRPLTIASMVALALAFAADFRGDSGRVAPPVWSTSVQQARVACAAAAAQRVSVPVTPQDVPTNWAAEVPCRWLGAD